MKKIKLLFLVAFSVLIFTSCGDKYSVKNLKKNDKLLKETVIKCKEKQDEKICKNAEQAQNELAQEAWNKVKPEINAKLEKMKQEMMKGSLLVTIENMPPKFWEYEAKLISTTPDKAKEFFSNFLQKSLKGITSIELSYNLENVKTGRTSIGRNYAVIPTETAILIEGQKVSGKQTLLTFEDEGNWYIINLDKKYMHVLKEMYADLVEVKMD